MSSRPITSPTFSPAQGCSPILQEQGRRCWITHKPSSQGPEKHFEQRQQMGVSKKECPFSLLPGGKQSWWFPKQEAKPGSFLTQFTPLPVQKGANCTSQSCLSRKVYPKGGQALLHNHPLSKSSPGKLLSSRDTAQPQLHSRDPWV